ncbi:MULTISPECIES: DMT family transporter [Bacillus]|uniref:Threonine/homoserine efflux transporter RhtA n=1 Tax=Bacillus mycoides TaxID=1405 RepID=A0A3D9VDF5_BACMY|nr:MULTISPECIES: DMT family transporter [Bacillus]RBP30149.1 threonine/homoserine efflux transporter RhtA [Bacillus sp. DB-2]REF39792.1 threonine/homoserine efflux transporter RhtA [Bacillus mycoides]
MTQKQANFLLATVSIGWGTSYIFMKVLADTVSPFTVVALRFGIAFLIMIVIFNRKLININIKMLSYSAIVGVLLCGIFISLMYGMKTTTASSAGFLTSTTVILVPALQTLIIRKLPRKEVIYGVTTVSVGLALLTIKDDFTFALGSLLCLVAAFLYGIHIIVTNYFVQRVDAFQLGVFQLGFAFLFALVGNFTFEAPVLPNGVIEWSAILGLAIICSAYGFVIQPIVQKYITPESTGFLFSLEPVFSAVFSFIFLNEIMGGQEYLGALLILSGVLIANTSFKKQIVLKEM